MTHSLSRRLAAEFAGSAILLAGIVGSGIMGERLSGGNVALALLANAVATGGVLFAIILTFGAISGAHFNPVVTCSVAGTASLPWRIVPAYLSAQLSGAIAGVLLAHVMFDLTPIALGTHIRNGPAQWVAEGVATFGLLAVIRGVNRYSLPVTAGAVAAYIVGAYWFTASTSFANPAVTVARSLTDSFAGIRPADAPGFIAAQCIGGIAASRFFRWLDAPARAAA